MTKIFRRIIFWSFVAFFIILVPLILAYARGYSYDWSGHRFVKTGAFYFKSNPAKVKVFINGKEKGKTNNLIKKINPGPHKISIHLDGYHPWSKTLYVESNQITQAKNIVLFPKEPKIEKEAQWTLALEDFFKTTKEILDNERAAGLISSSSTLAWTTCQAKLLHLEAPSLLLYGTDLMSGHKQQISLQPLPEKKENDQKYQISCANTEKISVLDPSGELFLFNSQEGIFKKIGENIKGVRFSQDLQKLAYWTNYEIWVLYQKEIPEKILITRLSQPIQDLVWYSQDDGHIIFAAADMIKIAELDTRDFINIVDFAEIQNPQLFYSAKDKTLYILSEGTIYKTKI